MLEEVVGHLDERADRVVQGPARRVRQGARRRGDREGPPRRVRLRLRAADGPDEPEALRRSTPSSSRRARSTRSCRRAWCARWRKFGGDVTSMVPPSVAAERLDASGSLRPATPRLAGARGVGTDERPAGVRPRDDAAAAPRDDRHRAHDADVGVGARQPRRGARGARRGARRRCPRSCATRAGCSRSATSTSRRPAATPRTSSRRPGAGRADGRAHRGGARGAAGRAAGGRARRGRQPAPPPRGRGLHRPEARRVRGGARAHDAGGGPRAASSSRRSSSRMPELDGGLGEQDDDDMPDAAVFDQDEY